MVRLCSVQFAVMRFPLFIKRRLRPSLSESSFSRPLSSSPSGFMFCFLYCPCDFCRWPAVSGVSHVFGRAGPRGGAPPETGFSCRESAAGEGTPLVLFLAEPI